VTRRPLFARWGNPLSRWLRPGKERPPAQQKGVPVPALPETEGTLLQASGPAAMPMLDLAGLEKQVARLGREQFKLNALLEAQQQQTQSAVQRLQEQDARREKERAELLMRREAERVEARMQVIARLLPILDGLDEALVSGRHLLASIPAAHPPRVPPPRAESSSAGIAWVAWSSVLLERLLFGPLRPAQAQPTPGVDPAWAAWQDAHRAWLHGLELVRARLLDILAAEGVQPIAARGTVFDPRRHVALGTAPVGPEAPEGTIVAELRRGYGVDERVLRYAEVTVASAESEEQ